MGTDTTFPWPTHSGSLSKPAIQGFNLIPEPFIARCMALVHRVTYFLQ